MSKKKHTTFTVPLDKNQTTYSKGLYNKYPSFDIGEGKIDYGYDKLTEKIFSNINNGLRVLAIDGYQGINWDYFINTLTKYLNKNEIKPTFANFNKCLKPSEELEKQFKNFLGGNDRIFGKHYPLSIETFLDPGKVSDMRIDASIKRADKSGELYIIYGNGSALIELYDELWYLDLPKDIIQERFREKEINNITSKSESFEKFYKRSYFVEWPALNRHKQSFINKIGLLIDYTSENEPSFINGTEYRKALDKISKTPFRVKPWFAPGPWGGQFMKGHMNLPKDEPNFAWSFEMIVPENGIILESDNNYLEFSFDMLMFRNYQNVLGNAANQFLYEWPIRFDYLDTIDGGSLSTQVHPRPNYIKKHFGETYTQDETYYIVNSKPGAKVYLGLRNNTKLDKFKNVLNNSVKTEEQIDIDQYVYSVKSKPHDLFLIPNGTVHCSGEDNLVLEISATPYIFTFKIYDYLRRDLEGKLRPINIERGFENIREECKEDFVNEELIIKEKLIEQGDDWKLLELYNKPFTFYKIFRIDFSNEYEFSTNYNGYGINLVQGESIEVTSENGVTQNLSYLETMLIPAATNKVKFFNKSNKECKVVLVYIKEEIGKTIPVNFPND